MEAYTEQVQPADLPAFAQVHTNSLYEQYAAFLLKRNQPMQALLMIERGRGQAQARQANRNQADFSGYFSFEDARTLHTRLATFTQAQRQWRRCQRQQTSPPAGTPIPPATADANKVEKRFLAARNDLTRVYDTLIAHYPAYKCTQGRQEITQAQTARTHSCQPGHAVPGVDSHGGGWHLRLCAFQQRRIALLFRDHNAGRIRADGRSLAHSNRKNPLG